MIVRLAGARGAAHLTETEARRVDEIVILGLRRIVLRVASFVIRGRILQS
jgi:hypothetical protein